MIRGPLTQTTSSLPPNEYNQPSSPRDFSKLPRSAEPSFYSVPHEQYYQKLMELQGNLDGVSLKGFGTFGEGMDKKAILPKEMALKMFGKEGLAQLEAKPLSKTSTGSNGEIIGLMDMHGNEVSSPRLLEGPTLPAKPTFMSRLKSGFSTYIGRPLSSFGSWLGNGMTKGFQKIKNGLGSMWDGLTGGRDKKAKEIKSLDAFGDDMAEALAEEAGKVTDAATKRAEQATKGLNERAE